MKKTLITGTGRAGTTFLVRLLTLCGLPTGYEKQQIIDNRIVNQNCNSGLEDVIPNAKINKDPGMIFNERVLQIKNYELIILPVRSYEEAALSREKIGLNKAGGLFCAHDLKSQLDAYYKAISNLILYIAKFEIDLLLIDFDKMVTDKEYLYKKLSEYFFIEKDVFMSAYHKASAISKRV